MLGPGDSAQERAIATRRAMEADRLKRIKDPKSRVMGIDTEALAAGVAEKQASAAAEKALRMEYDHQRLQQDAQLAYLEQERLRAERKKAQFVDQFRATEQGKEKSREYDLNDPLSKYKDLPGRVGDEDPRLSVSGMQQFHGEDLSYAQRIKVQQEELREWCVEQAEAKAHAKAVDAQRDIAYAQRALDIDNMKLDLEATSRMARTSVRHTAASHRAHACTLAAQSLAPRELLRLLLAGFLRRPLALTASCVRVLTVCQANVAVAEYQLAQAAAKREREAAAQKSELQDNIEEIQANLAGDMLTENPSVGLSFIAPNRVRPDHYKGMSPMEQATIVAAQEAQRLQNRAMAAANKAEDRYNDAAMEGTRRAGAYQDAQVAAMRADMRKQLMEDNLQMAKQQYATKSFLTEKVFKNSIDASFFDQFGTSSR